MKVYSECAIGEARTYCFRPCVTHHNSKRNLRRTRFAPAPPDSSTASCPYQELRSNSFGDVEVPPIVRAGWVRREPIWRRAFDDTHKKKQPNDISPSRICKNCVCSGGKTFVTMTQSANLRNLHDPTHGWRLNRSTDSCVLAQRQMRPGLFVVCEIGFQDSTQTGLIQNDDVIQALSSNRSDQSLEIGVLPRTLGRSQDFVNAHRFCHLAEFQPVSAVAIAQQIPRRIVPRKCSQKLSGGPRCGGVSGHRKMHQTSSVMAENHEREQDLERDGGHDEEI